MAIQSVEPRRWHTFNLLDCFVISFLAMTEILARVATADFRPCYIYLSCTASTLVIASVARQSRKNNACAIRRTSIIYYLCSKKIPRHLAGAGEHKLYFYLHAPCDTATAWFSIHTLPDGVHAEFTNVIVFASADL